MIIYSHSISVSVAKLVDKLLENKIFQITLLLCSNLLLDKTFLKLIHQPSMMLQYKYLLLSIKNLFLTFELIGQTKNLCK
jgi:hypothetical protein